MTDTYRNLMQALEAREQDLSYVCGSIVDPVSAAYRAHKALLEIPTEHIMATAGDNVPSEIEYRNTVGKVVGYWAYGEFQPDYPYQGMDKKVLVLEAVDYDDLEIGEKYYMAKHCYLTRQEPDGDQPYDGQCYRLPGDDT